ncbi:MAG: lamin tail domain-containing protein [Dehalococcoidia bacterium]
MKDLRPAPAIWRPSTPALIGFLALLLLPGLAVGQMSLVSAQTPGIGITSLKCNEDPEVVAVTNQGSSVQDLAGWSLKSDPQNEVFDLSGVGVLAPGATVFVQSGPHASGSFVWSTNLIFRDGDSSDYARIVDNQGSTVQEVKCASPGPTTSSTPSPTPQTVAAIPSGGGPPGPGEPSSRSATMTMAAGGLLITLAFAAFVAAFSPISAQASVGPAAPNRSDPTPAGKPGWAFALFSVSLMVVIVRLMTGRRR